MAILTNKKTDLPLLLFQRFIGLISQPLPEFIQFLFLVFVQLTFLCVNLLLLKVKPNREWNELRRLWIRRLNGKRRGVLLGFVVSLTNSVTCFLPSLPSAFAASSASSCLCLSSATLALLSASFRANLLGIFKYFLCVEQGEEKKRKIGWCQINESRRKGRNHSTIFHFAQVTNTHAFCCLSLDICSWLLTACVFCSCSFRIWSRALPWKKE